MLSDFPNGCSIWTPLICDDPLVRRPRLSDSSYVVDQGALKDAIKSIAENGFVVIRGFDQAPFDNNPANVFAYLQSAFSLPRPHIPIQYDLLDRERLFRDGICRIGFFGEMQHASFHSCDGQPAHTDGTLDDSNDVKLSAMHCVRPAVSGGETSIYNILGAAWDAAQGDLKAIKPLFEQDALLKFSPKKRDRGVWGPVFYISDSGQIGVRYADSDLYSSWSNKRPISEIRLGIKRVFAENQKYGRITSVNLTTGDLLLIANNRVAHGRSRYTDEESERRELWRALYAEMPSLCD